jgi:hypothetical protein
VVSAVTTLAMSFPWGDILPPYEVSAKLGLAQLSNVLAIHFLNRLRALQRVPAGATCHTVSIAAVFLELCVFFAGTVNGSNFEKAKTLGISAQASAEVSLPTVAQTVRDVFRVSFFERKGLPQH